jgi:hypothetical protein
MSTPQLQMLISKCDNNLVPCCTNIGMHGSSFKKTNIYQGCQNQQNHNDENMFILFERFK